LMEFFLKQHYPPSTWREEIQIHTSILEHLNMWLLLET
jgi:hypothetical protein